MKTILLVLLSILFVACGESAQERKARIEQEEKKARDEEQARIFAERDAAEQQQQQATADSLLLKFPRTTAKYDPALFSANQYDSLVMNLYALITTYADPAFVDLCHALPYGGEINNANENMSMLLYALQVSNQGILDDLVGNTHEYQTPKSSALFVYKKDNAANMAYLRTLDKTLTMQEKAWLAQTGGNVVIHDKENGYFLSQALIKSLIKELYERERLQSLIKKIKQGKK